MPLGLDFLTFLATTVLVIPLFKSVKASPVLGYGQIFAVLLTSTVSNGTPKLSGAHAVAANAGFCSQA